MLMRVVAVVDSPLRRAVLRDMKKAKLNGVDSVKPSESPTGDVEQKQSGSTTSPSVRTTTKSRAEKRRAILRLAIGLGIPLLQIPLQYKATATTSSRTSAASFKELLSANLNLNRYVRLMALASIDLLLTVLLASFFLYSNGAVTGLSLWISWADTHSNFSRVVQVPGIYWRADLYSGVSVETLRWATMACMLLFFAYFEFADEAIKNYRGAFNSMARRVGYSTAGSSGLSLTRNTQMPLSSSSSHGATLPVFIRKDTTQNATRSAPSRTCLRPTAGSRRSSTTPITLAPLEPAHTPPGGHEEGKKAKGERMQEEEGEEAGYLSLLLSVSAKIEDKGNRVGGASRARRKEWVRLT
ncbi:pheromone A receptor-domain-containing protein [Mycena leptocephala]|nr:pheromone A receptor-domain-containing protein [Mycena leptocephala]